MAAAVCVAAAGYAHHAAEQLVQGAFRQADHALCPKADYTPPFPEIRELLHRCADSGLKLAILSSDSQENVQAFVDRYQLSQIQHIAGADSERRKPDPVLLQRLCNQIGVWVGATLMIGDAAVDVAMANAAGAAGSIGVTWGGATASSLKEATAIATQIQDLQLR